MSKLKELTKRYHEPAQKLGKVLSKAVDRFEVTILVISTAALAILLIINVIMRNVYRSIHFAEELSRLFIMLITFVGTSYAARRARHIRMGAVLELLPQKIEKILVLIISLISAIVFFILAKIALEYVIVLYQRQTVTSSLRAPYWTFVLIAPIGLFMAGFQYIRTFIKNLKEEDIWLSPEQKDEFEEEEAMVEKAIAAMDLAAQEAEEKR